MTLGARMRPKPNVECTNNKLCERDKQSHSDWHLSAAFGAQAQVEWPTQLLQRELIANPK